MALIVRRPPVDTTGPVHHHTIITPVLPGRRAELGATLAGFERSSPFARIADVHVARLTLLDELPGRTGRLEPIDPPHLLFGVSFDGPLTDLAARMAASMASDADAVWGCCAGYRGSADPALGQYLAAHRVPSVLAFATFAARAGEVQDALALQRRIAALAEQAPSLEPAELRAAIESLS